MELFTKHAIESTSGEKSGASEVLDQLLTSLKVDVVDPSTLWIAGHFANENEMSRMGNPSTSWDCWTIYN